MATFRSARYPGLTLQDEGGIWAVFVGGQFHTDDEAVADRLRAVPASEGITEDPAADGPAVERPAKSASKAEWVAYAVARGLDEADAEKATRDELIVRFSEED